MKTSGNTSRRPAAGSHVEIGATCRSRIAVATVVGFALAAIGAANAAPAATVSLCGVFDASRPVKSHCAIDRARYQVESPTPTPAVLGLFQAARALDEKQFKTSLANAPDFAKYIVDGHTLLAVLLQPSSPQGGTMQGTENQKNPDAQQRAKLFADHRRTIPARMRMLASILKRGAKPNVVTAADRLPALHLALVFGTPAMVDLLLSSGADPNQAAGLRDPAPPIEFMLRLAYTGRQSGFPDLLTRRERAAMLLSLLGAGAKAPVAPQAVDAADPRSRPPRALSDLMTVETGIWEPLVEMTEGTAVLNAVSRLAGLPEAPSSRSNLLARAAFAGNKDAVQWLQKRLPRYYFSDEGRDEPLLVKHDAWAEAASAALASPMAVARTAIFKMLVRNDFDWSTSSSSAFGMHFLIGLPAEDRYAAPSKTVFANLVATGDASLLEWVVGTGAVQRATAQTATQASIQRPDANDNRGGSKIANPVGDGLIEALALHRLDLVQQLLAAGASVLLRSSEGRVPLSVALDPPSSDKGTTQKKSLEGADRLFFEQVVPMMFGAVRRKDILTGDKSSDGPLSVVLMSDDSRSKQWAEQLLAMGFSGDRLPVSALVNLIRKGDRSMALAMIDAGAGKEGESGWQDDDNAWQEALWQASLHENAAVLERLLILRQPHEGLAAWQRSFMVDVAAENKAATLDMLQRHGWAFDRATSQLALNSMQPEAIANALKYADLTLTSLCLMPEDPWGLPLWKAVRSMKEPAWENMLKLGLAQLTSCTVARTEQAPLAPMMMLAAAIFQDPFALAGARKISVPQRIEALRQHGMEPADLRHDAFKRIMPSVVSEPAFQPTLQALGADAAVANTSSRSRTTQPHPEALVGGYRVIGAGEAAINLALKADGRFSWEMNYGASDRYAEGSWYVDDGRVVFESDHVEPFAWFKMTGYTQYPDGPAVGRDITFELDMGKSRIEIIQGLLNQGPFELLYMKFFDDQPRLERKPKFKPLSVALWFHESGALLATEMPLPDVERLQSVSFALQLPTRRPAAAFNSVMEIDDNGFKDGGMVYRRR